MSDNTSLTTEKLYDELPYRSVSYAGSQPSNIACIALLFGLSPAAPENSRVLELGCASGGNIIPLAVRYPNSTFLGIDLGERHVREAQEQIAALGLTNIEIRKGDIAEIDLSDDKFDFIIAHGVYSWVPEAAQDAILKIGGQSLTENGVLYVSYNIFPGWNMRSVIRDICMYHAGKSGNPKERVARARWALQQVADTSSEDSPYGQLLRNEAKLNATQPDSYILGEFLADYNSPCYFHEFIERASKRGVSYLSEADLSASVPETLGEEKAKLIRSIAGDSGVAIEQYMDFFGGRQFRRSILTRADQASRISRSIAADKLASLYFSSILVEEKNGESKPESEAKQDGDADASSDSVGVIFQDGRSKINVTDPVLLDILRYLEAAYPENRSPKEICDHLVELGKLEENQRETMLKVFFTLTVNGKLQISASQLKSGRANDEKPKVWALAQQEALIEQDWITSLRHSPISIKPNIKQVLKFVDGTSDFAGITDKIIDGLLDGSIKLDGKDLPEGTKREAMQAGTEKTLNAILTMLERNALLAPAS